MAPSPGTRWWWTRVAAMSSRWKWRMYFASRGTVGGRVVADAVEVADVEVQADRRRIDVLHELQELVGRLDQQARLRLDEQQHAFLLGVLGDRLEHLDEQLQGR